MNLTGTITGLSRDFKTGRPVISIQVNENLDGIDDIIGKLLDITIKIFRERRSKDANAYFHVLVGKIANKTEASRTAVKNRLIREYGQEALFNGQPLLCYFPEALNVLNDPTNHFRPSGRTELINGEMCCEYVLMRGSHTYDTAEMSRLIDATVEEAKELGIETMTPEQLNHLYELWEKTHGQKENREISQE